LIAGLGDARNHAGRACVAPDLGAAIVKGKCFCARIKGDVASPEYLSLVLSSPLGAQVIGMAGHGSTRTMINLDVVKAARIPLPSLAYQREVVRRVSNERAQCQAVRSKLNSQIDLLIEHRQALITSAVTGGLDAPGMAA